MLNEALKKIHNRRIAAQEKAARNYERALECEEFLQAERAYNQAVRTFEPDLAEIERLRQKKQEILKRLGLDIEPVYHCLKCNDSGYVGNKLCSCVKEEIIKSINGSDDIASCGLKDLKTDIFTDPAQKVYMETMYKNIAVFCERFPNTNITNMIFSGATGCGKTHLLKSIAAELSIKGFFVNYFTAFGFNNYLLNVHLAPLEQKPELLAALIESDLLIIDDLGTEPTLNNVTVEYLFNIINERKNLRRHIIIATNLKQAEIWDRYGERIFSRLNDKSDTAFFEMTDFDIRTKKRK